MFYVTMIGKCKCLAVGNEKSLPEMSFFIGCGTCDATLLRYGTFTLPETDTENKHTQSNRNLYYLCVV